MNFEQMMQTEIQKLYDTETQLMNGMTLMMEKAQSPELRQAFEQHRNETEGQIRRLEQVAQAAGFTPQGETSLVAQALVQEAQQVLQSAQPSPVTDALIIACAQKAEHVEIACYGTARTLAQQVGMQEAVGLLEQTLEEEKRADQLLTQIAESGVNQQAVSQSSQATMM
jgi:ferritin-like metal-binding protein YciE